MNFWQNVVSTFIGALLGFVFSICLFYLTNKWSKRSQKKNLEKNLLKELDYDEDYLQKALDKLKRVIEKITANDPDVYEYFNYTSYQRLFISMYFQQGYLYERLEPDDLNLLDNILTHMTFIGENYINETIQKWKDKKIEQREALRTVQFERDNIEKYVKAIRQIKQKITKK